MRTKDKTLLKILDVTVGITCLTVMVLAVALANTTEASATCETPVFEKIEATDLYFNNKTAMTVSLEYSDSTPVEMVDNIEDDTECEVMKTTFVGDSRTVGMEMTGVIDESFDVIAKVGEGFYYLIENIDQIKNVTNTNIVINLGVNDLGNINKYIDEYKELSNEIDDTNKIYLVSVNPIEYHDSITNSDVEEFNNKIKMLSEEYDNIEYIDTYNGIEWNEGFTVDGLHYTSNYYCEIYSYITQAIYGKEIA